MASAYSIIHDYQNYIQPVDMELAGKVLAYKQQKYDINSAKLQAQVDELANIDLYRDVDKQYFNNKVRNILDNINHLSKVDLSSDGITRNISRAIKGALDDKVMTAYSSTKLVRNYQKQVDEIKTKHPDKYSAINDAYSQQPIMDWLSNPNAGAPILNAPEYVPYTDVNKNKEKLLKELYKDSDSFIEQRDGKGNIIKTKFKGLDPDQIDAIFKVTLSPDEQKQIQINAWATYGRDPMGTFKIFENYRKARVSELEKKRDYYNKLGKKDKANYFKKQAESLNSELSNIQDPLQMGIILERERMLGGLRTEFVKRQKGFEYKTDKAYWDARKDARDGLKLELERAKLALKYKSAGLDANGNPINPNGNLPAGVTTTIERNVNENTPDKINLRDELTKKVTSEFGVVKALTDEIENNYLKDKKSEIDERAKIYASENNVTLEEAKAEVIKRDYYSNISDPKIKEKFFRSYANYHNYLTNYQGYIEENKKVLKDNIGKYINNGILDYEAKKSLKFILGDDVNLNNINSKQIDDILKIKEVNDLFATYYKTNDPEIKQKLLSELKHINPKLDINYDTRMYFFNASKILDWDNVYQKTDEQLGDNAKLIAGHKVITAESIIGKGEKKYSEAQAIFQNMAKTALDNPDTEVIYNGNILTGDVARTDKSVKGLLKFGKDTSVKVILNDGGTGKSTIVVNGVKILAPNEVVNKYLTQAGIKPDLESIDTGSVHFKGTYETSMPIKYNTADDIETHLDSYEDIIGKENTDYLYKPTFIDNESKLLKDTGIYNDERKAYLGHIINNSDKLTTKLKAVNRTVFIELYNDNGDKIFEYKKRMPTQIEAGALYRDLQQEQGVAPQLLLKRALDGIILDESANKDNATYTLKKLYNEMINE